MLFWAYAKRIINWIREQVFVIRPNNCYELERNLNSCLGVLILWCQKWTCETSLKFKRAKIIAALANFYQNHVHWIGWHMWLLYNIINYCCILFLLLLLFILQIVYIWGFALCLLLLACWIHTIVSIVSQRRMSTKWRHRARTRHPKITTQWMWFVRQ